MIRKPWTKKEIETLKRLYPVMLTSELAEQLGRTERSLYAQAQILGLSKAQEYLDGPQSGRLSKRDTRGLPTRFKPGHIPHNKGSKGWQAGGKAYATKFKSGNRPHTWVPIGSERISKDGIRQRKVSDTGYAPSDWKSVHSLVYQEHFGPIPAGHIVVFRNGDRNDLGPENLELITKAENMRRNTIHRLPEEIADLCRLRGVLNRRIRERIERDEKQDRGFEEPPVCHHRGAAGR